MSGNTALSLCVQGVGRGNFTIHVEVELVRQIVVCVS